MTVAFSVMVVLGAIQFALGEGVGDWVKRAIAFCLASALIAALHFWINTLKTGDQSLLFNVVVGILVVEFARSHVFLALLVFDIGEVSTNLVFLAVFQLVHLAVYMLNWIISEEAGPIHHRNLSVEQIAAVNERTRTPPLPPQYQDVTED